MKDIPIVEKVEDNIELHSYKLSDRGMHISQLVQEIAFNTIIVPRIIRSIVWSKKQVKDMIISLFKGLPIGRITFWRLYSKNPNVKQYRTIIKTLRPLPEWPNLIFDGLQRCAALSAVFSREEIAIDEKFQGIDLYYNLIKDVFMFKEEIKGQLDETWINLKDTYNPVGRNADLKESFIQGFKSILDELDRKDYFKVRDRIDRIFGLVNRKLKISIYDGDSVDFTFDLLTLKNKHSGKDIRSTTSNLKSLLFLDEA